MKNTEFQLIICIINAGFSETVMDAAREAGARGGSITHCRGTSNAQMEKKYGVYVTPEKEMVWIVTKSEETDKILTAIHASAGKDNPGKLIAFSLPVENVVGMKFVRQFENKEE